MEVSEANWVKVALSIEDRVEVGTLVGLTTFSLAEGVGFKRENKKILDFYNETTLLEACTALSSFSSISLYVFSQRLRQIRLLK